MICFWCKTEWVGDHVCQEAFEILGERQMARGYADINYAEIELRILASQWLLSDDPYGFRK